MKFSEMLEEIIKEQHKNNAKKDFKLTDPRLDLYISEEGIIKSVAADIVHKVHSGVTKVKGWFEGIESKRQHLNEIAQDTIEWLKDEDRSNPNLYLDVGSIKTQLFKSKTFNDYRYYYLLHDSIYNKIVKDLKENNVSELEDFFEHIANDLQIEITGMSSDSKERKETIRMLDSIKNIKDLIVIVEKYRARANMIFDLLLKQERKIKGFPFQLMLSGMADLRRTVKRIVNLAE